MTWWDERFASPPTPPASSKSKTEEKSKSTPKPTTGRVDPDPNDPLRDHYGDRSLIRSTEQMTKDYVKAGDITGSWDGKEVNLRARVHATRGKGKSCFLVLRQQTATIQALLITDDKTVSKSMVKYAMGIPKESVIDIEATAAHTDFEIVSCSQKDVELHIKAIRVVSRSEELPFQITDAARSEAEIAEAEKAGQKMARVHQSKRLDHRFLDLRTLANQAIFRIQSHVCRLFRDQLTALGFMEIHSPKLVAGTSEGGSAVFKLKYMGQSACLAQSPQLYKQMAICADFDRVFEIGPVFRAENSDTHRHLCEFTGLDFEMAIYEHYFEVLDVLETTFERICNGLSTEATSDLEAVWKQYPADPFTFKPIRLSFKEGMEMLKGAGYDAQPLEDLTTELERALGKLVKEKFDSDFYILYRYPLSARPFYTMPCADDADYSNSYDVFMRGEEIISGAQRVHDPEMLTERAKAHGIPVASIKSYIDAFRLGAYPHGGVGVGLDRVVMLYLGVNDIRKTSLFPRDLRRLTP